MMMMKNWPRRSHVGRTTHAGRIKCETAKLRMCEIGNVFFFFYHLVANKAVYKVRN